MESLWTIQLLLDILYGIDVVFSMSQNNNGIEAY
jgi:hypothetical protein